MNQKGISSYFSLLTIIVFITIIAIGLFGQTRIQRYFSQTNNLIFSHAAENDLKKVYIDFATAINKKDFKTIYENFALQDIKDDIKETEFSNTLQSLYSTIQINNIQFVVKKVSVKDNEALVDREVKYCLDDGCTNKKTENSKVRWVKDGNSWKTATEFPVCYRSMEKGIDDTFSSNKVTENGVEIKSSIDCSMFPMYWSVSPDNNKLYQFSEMADKLSDENLSRSIASIKVGLKKYPLTFLKSNLKFVYLLKQLNFYGVPFGSTYSNTKVYLTSGPVSLGYTDSYIEGNCIMNSQVYFTINIKIYFPKMLG
jgi:hypothetical protein